MVFTKKNKQSYYKRCLQAAMKMPLYILRGDANITAMDWLSVEMRGSVPDNLHAADDRQCRAKAVRRARYERIVKPKKSRR